MSATAITVRPLLRPTFDNRNIDCRGLWIVDNTAALVRYWHDCGQVLGMSSDDDTDLDLWLDTQYDREVSQMRRIPHGAGAL
jgi:hypothetical protein